MSSGAVLTVVALLLALVIAGLFRLVAVLDSAELGLRRLVAELRATRKTVGAAGDLAAAVERDVTRGHAALTQLEDLKRGHRPSDPPRRAAGPTPVGRRGGRARRRTTPGSRPERSAG